MLGLMFAAPAAYADGYAGRAAASGCSALLVDGLLRWRPRRLGHGRYPRRPKSGGRSPAGLLSTDFSVNGALYGGQIGYNWQSGLYVFGIEGSLSASSIQGTTACVAILECKRDVDWLATLTGRVGYAMGPTLVYGMAGVAWADVSTNVGVVGLPLLSGSDTHTGWVAGFGFEYALSSHISTRVEYAHIDLGSSSQTLSGTGVLAGVGPVLTDSVNLKLDTIRLGVNVKLY